TARRRAERVLQPSLASASPLPSSDPPLPLFPPRQALAERREQGWRFRFVGRSVDTPSAIPWRDLRYNAADQLWRMNLHYMEYLEEMDDRSVGELIGQWIAANRPYLPGSTFDSWNAY